MRILTSTKLDNCDGMEQYVNLIMNTAHKLRGINCNVSEDWIGTFLLAGLPEIYQPMIMAIESSGIAITADSIKTKLLQDANSSQRIYFNESMALSTIGHGQHIQNNNHRGPRCYTCNEYGHIAANCRKKNKENVSVSTHRSNSGTNGKVMQAYAFYAGFSGQGDTNRFIGSETSGQLINRNRLNSKSIGRTTLESQHYDPFSYVYVDDVISLREVSNLSNAVLDLESVQQLVDDLSSHFETFDSTSDLSHEVMQSLNSVGDETAKENLNLSDDSEHSSDSSSDFHGFDTGF